MSHYYSERQDSPLRLAKINANLRNTAFEFFTGSGTFSRQKVDLGTALLINCCIIKEDWHVLDFGCGYGAVGIVIKKLFPSCTVTMVDINARAVKLAKMNAKLHNVDCDIFRNDMLKNIEKRFDTILLNPPYAAGREQCYGMIADAKNHLNSSGMLQLVARHQKGGRMLEKKMEELFGNVDEITKKSGYRVYVSKKND